MGNYKSLTDDLLVKLYSDGVNEAFDTLLERYKDRLYSYIYNIVRNEDMTDDIFQETFVKVIVRIKQNKYVESGKFYSWLSTIAHNLIIDYFRTEQNERVVSNDDYEYDLFNSAAVLQNSIESDIVAEQTLEDVKKLLECLPENQKEVVKMRFYQDMSFKEISDITGVSINTALGRMRYAILNMRKLAQEKNLFLSIG